MLNKEKHQLIMGKILRDIYTDVSIAPFLGLKGGTCAYLFYDMPRFSVDLDFDFLPDKEIDQKIIFDKLIKIIDVYGQIKDRYIKRFTIFALLSYDGQDRNIKLEISTRDTIADLRKHYTLKEYLGISMLAAKKEYLFSSKLAALTLRSKTAMRDVYDIYYFAKNNWDIDKEVIELQTKKTFARHISDCIVLAGSIKENQIVRELGELLNKKEKDWAKKHLKEEVLFLLKNYQAVMK